MLIAVLTGGMLVSNALAQTGDDALRFFQRSPGIGPANVGMAGVGIAGVGDPAALVVNPAGLGLARTSTISGSFASFELRDQGVFFTPDGSFSDDSRVRNTGLGSLSAVYKVPTTQGTLVLGISYQQLGSFGRDLYFQGTNGANSITDYFMPLPGEFSLSSDGSGVTPDFTRTLSFIAYETYGIDFDQGLYDAGDPVPFLPAVSAGTVEQTGSALESGRMSELNFGGSIEAARGILVGASVNVPFSRYTFNRRFEEDDINNDNDGTNGTTDFSYLDFSEWYQSDMVGINARLGISALLSPRVRLGAVIETPTYVSVQDDYGTDLYTEFDNGDAYEYGNDSSQDAGSGTFDYDILTPWRAGAGLSFQSSGLKLMADAEWVDWSQLELRSRDYSFADENRTIRTNFDAVVNARLGVSYETGDFTIRGGVAVYPDPRNSRYLDDPAGSNLDRDRKFFSLGLGYRISNELSIDLGLMQERFDDLYRPYIEVDGAPWVEEEVVRNRVQIGLTLVM